jgi:hypothetical protein
VDRHAGELAQPTAVPVAAHGAVARDGEVHRTVEPVDVGDVQPPGAAAVGIGRLEGDPPPVERLAGPAADARQQRGWSGEDRGDGQAATLVGELDVVDLAHEPPVDVDHLPVEEVERAVDRPFESVPDASRHCPILVQIIRGIAAADAAEITSR